MTSSANARAWPMRTRRQQARCGFRNEAELDEGRRECRVGRGDDVIAMQQHGGADADGKSADRGNERLSVARQARGETRR